MITNNNDRSVDIPCVECGRKLRFRIENDVVVESEGRTAINVPCAVCEDCVELLLSRMDDPPGLVIFEGLSAIVAQELLESFPLLLKKSEALKFFTTLFPELGALDSNMS
jgi:hypothetical protein